MAKHFLRLIFFISASLLLAQEVSQERLVRFALWAQQDAYPGYFDGDATDEEQAKNKSDADDSINSVPIRKIKELAPYIVQGMVYGWKFDYTPSDKARKVPEFFDVKEVTPMPSQDLARISFAKPWYQEEKLWAWVEYARTPEQIYIFKSWHAILYPRIKGVGYARLSEGFDGIRKACEEALKNAVREYERTRIKTKPKQIEGTALIIKPPQIGIDAGRYKVTLDFFMQSDRIIEYKTF